MPDNEPIDSSDDSASAERGGFIALAVVAAAIGAGAAVLLSPEQGLRSRKRRSARDGRFLAAAGFLVGAGLTALLTPESGPATRKLVSSTLSRIKVGAIDRIERHRLTKVPPEADQPAVRTVQELGRDPNNVF
jgi:gas vesicle protein